MYFKKTFLVLLALIRAQTDFRPGYVIKAQGDTLQGKIDYRGDLLMSELCRFSDGEKVSKFTPYDVASYRFTNGKYFISQNVKGKQVFLEYLIKGKISVYHLRDEEGNHYFLQKDNGKIIEMPYQEEIRFSEEINGNYFYKSTAHIGILSYFMQDAPELLPQIEALKEPEHKALIKLAENYHHKVCKDEACIVYEKNKNPLKVDLEIAGGGVQFKDTEIFDQYSSFQTGILAHFWMPGVNEKLFFRTGLLYAAAIPASSGKIKNSSASLYKLPLQLEYRYPKGMFRPAAAFGISLYSPFYQSVAAMGGFNLKLNKTISLTANYEADFTPAGKFPLFPKYILSQAVLAGLQITF